jgi:hypothetical protein
MSWRNWFSRPKLPPTGNLSTALQSYINAVKLNKNSANITNVKNKMNAFILAAQGAAAAPVAAAANVPIPRGTSNFGLTQSYTNLKNAINAANKSKLKNLSNAVNQALSSYNAQANNNKKLPASLVNNAKRSVAKARALNSASENVLSAAKAFMNKAKMYKNVNARNLNAYSANLKNKYNALGNLKNVFKNNYTTINGNIYKKRRNTTRGGNTGSANNKPRENVGFSTKNGGLVFIGNGNNRYALGTGNSQRSANGYYKLKKNGNNKYNYANGNNGIQPYTFSNGKFSLNQ